MNWIKKSKNIWFCILLFLVHFYAFAQNNYFQQEVNYKINVQLNDRQHTLHATTEIEYINNSPQALGYIYFHLWPNAYNNSNTALGKQLLEHKKTSLYFSTPEERGYIDSLDFKVNGEKIKWEFDTENPDICKLFLNKTLQAGAKITISTPFFVKIPDARFSRLGHAGEAYFITQWYPKPAVYDNKGWHPMPYLDQGEFYSEFGSFDVSITLPKNYLLAATGDRVNALEEEQFLDKRVEETRALIKERTRRKDDLQFPPSELATKTIRFIQNNVHDFAWFADKRFYVLSDVITMPRSGKKVNTWIYFTGADIELWADALQYVNESALFYSRLNGDYPYNHITAVDGTIMAGGGMEYPNITVISSAASKHDLEITIAHEAGHNWFYGILGNNERDEPFLDEGINSYYEMRYNREKYPYKKLSEYLGADSSFKIFGLNKTPLWREKETAFMYSLKSRTDQAINLKAQDYTSVNYGTIIYSKTPLAMDYLMDYMGTEKFDKAMQYYFEKFKFKHPAADDFFNALSQSSGLDLEEIRKVLFASTQHIDYKIKSLKKDKEGNFIIGLKNKSNSTLPFNITSYNSGKVLSTAWYPGFKNKTTIVFKKDSADFIKIDGSDKMPDINRRNNFIYTQGIFKKRKQLQLNFISKLENPLKTQINYVPLLGFNTYNGFMAGVAFHNYGFYKRALEYYVAPLFGFKSKTPVGFALLDYNLFPKKRFQQITIGGKLKSFAYSEFETKYLNETNGTNFRSLQFNYIKLAPYVVFDLKKKKATSPIQQTIILRSSYLITDSLNITPYIINSIAKIGPIKKTSSTLISEVEYSLFSKRVIDPFNLVVNIQQSGQMSKIWATFNYQVSISKKNYMELRAFAGYLMSGTSAERGYFAFRPSGYSGYQDYLFEGNFSGRNSGSNFYNNQYLEKDANLKTWTLLSNSPDWMLALNIKSPKAGILPLRVFADVLTCDGSALKGEKLIWDAGLNVTLWKDIIEVYIPLAYSPYIKDILTLNNFSFYNRLRFTFNIHKLDPKNFIPRILNN